MNRKIKIKLVDFKGSTYIDFDHETNNANLQFIEVGDHIRILNIKNIFRKIFYSLNWSEDVFLIKKV